MTSREQTMISQLGLLNTIITFLTNSLITKHHWSMLKNNSSKCYRCGLPGQKVDIIVSFDKI